MKTLVGFITAILLSFSLVGAAMATPVDTYEFKSVDNQKRALELAH